MGPKVPMGVPWGPWGPYGVPTSWHARMFGAILPIQHPGLSCGLAGVTTPGQHSTIGVCSFCSAGKTSTEDRTSCISCEPGTHRAAEEPTCEQCPDGTHSSDGVECVACQPGTSPTDARDDCVACEAGKSSSWFPFWISMFPGMGNGFEDLEWKKSFVAKALKYKKDIVPAHIDGRNSNWFYNLSNWRRKLGIKANVEMFYLADEMFRQRNQTITIRFGETIPYESLDKSKTHQEWATEIRERVYALKERYPELTVVINGGITEMDQAIGHLEKVDGVMVGTLKPDPKNEESTVELMTTSLFETRLKEDNALMSRWSDGVELAMESEGFVEANIDLLQVRAIPKEL